MGERVELLKRIASPDTNPFLLCNVLARRARQLANRDMGPLSAAVINAAFVELLGGRLQPGFPSTTPAIAGDPPTGKDRDGAKAARGGRKAAAAGLP